MSGGVVMGVRSDLAFGDTEAGVAKAGERYDNNNKLKF
jgi:hypothetical protein